MPKSNFLRKKNKNGATADFKRLKAKVRGLPMQQAYVICYLLDTSQLFCSPNPHPNSYLFDSSTGCPTEVGCVAKVLQPSL